MTNEEKCNTKHFNNVSSGGGGAVYGLGFLGALFYFLQHSNSVGEMILGFVQAIFWPAIVVYTLLETWGF